jgi:hypothetical protein
VKARQGRSIPAGADLARGLVAGHKRRLGLLLVLAAALQNLGEVDARGRNAHAHLRGGDGLTADPSEWQGCTGGRAGQL